MEIRNWPGLAQLPYAVVECEGARHLLVGFVGLTVAATKPPVGMDRRLSDLNAHRLYIGSDAHFFVGPGRSLSGFRTAVELVDETRRRLGVRREDVVAFGTSFAAVASLWVGLEARAGLVLSGAPPVRLGRWLNQFQDGAAPAPGPELDLKNAQRAKRGRAPIRPETGGIRAALLELTRVDTDAEARAFYDSMLLGVARRADHAADLKLFVSPTDEVMEEVRWFDAQLAGHPTLRTEVVLGEYAQHADIKLPYFAYLRSVLKPLVAPGARIRDPAGRRTGGA